MGFWNLLKLRQHRQLIIEIFKPLAFTVNHFYAEQRAVIWLDPYVIGYFRGTFRTTLEAALAEKPVELTELEKDTLFYQTYAIAAKHVSFDQAFQAVRGFQAERKAQLRRGYEEGREVSTFALTNNFNALDLSRERTLAEHKTMLAGGYRSFLEGQGRTYDEMAALREAAINATIHAYVDQNFTTTPLS